MRRNAGDLRRLLRAANTFVGGFEGVSGHTTHFGYQVVEYIPVSPGRSIFLYRLYLHLQGYYKASRESRASHPPGVSVLLYTTDGDRTQTFLYPATLTQAVELLITIKADAEGGGAIEAMKEAGGLT